MSQQLTTYVDFFFRAFHFLSVRKLNKWKSVGYWIQWLLAYVYLVSKLIKYGTQIDLNCWVWKGGHSCYYIFNLYLKLRCMNLDSMPGANVYYLRCRIRELESESCTYLKIPVECCWIHYRVLKFQCNLLYGFCRASRLKSVQRNNFLSMQSAIWILQSTVPLLGLMHIEEYVW